jgi:hypothetical protein
MRAQSSDIQPKSQSRLLDDEHEREPMGLLRVDAEVLCMLKNVMLPDSQLAPRTIRKVRNQSGAHSAAKPNPHSKERT